MRIGISAEFISMKSGGPESYIANLLKALMMIDNNNDYNLYVINQEALSDFNIPDNFNICPLKLYNPWIRNTVIMPIELARRPVDILHVQNVVPLGYRGKLVVTIHDISFEIYPETFPRAMRLRLSMLVKSTARKANLVLTGSENTKKDLIELYRIPAEKIEVIPYAHNRIYRPIKDQGQIERIKLKYGIHGNFVLYAGTLQPRKNIVGLIKAWDIVRQKYKLKYKLVIVGKAGWLYSDILRMIQNHTHSEDIICAGYIRDDEMPFIFNAASVFIHPSFYEGFGLTVLEALACGVPVIASNNSSLPEVVGDAGILINPYNHEEIADAIYKIVTNPELRAHLISEGLQRSEKFSWEYTAQRTLDAYKKTYLN